MIARSMRWSLVAILAITGIIAGLNVFFSSKGITPKIPTQSKDETQPAKLRDRAFHKSRTEKTSSAKALYESSHDGIIEIPERFQLPGVTSAKTANNSSAWFQQFPLESRQKLEAFNRKNFGVFLVSSQDQVAWMAMHGYPLPEDVIAAENLSDTDLREIARAGNEKAAFLLNERNADKIKRKLEEYSDQGRTRSDFWSTDPEAVVLRQDQKDIGEIINKSKSPFKAFAQAQASLDNDNATATDAQVIGNLLWASRLGDLRAGQFLMEFVGSDPVRASMFAAASVVSINDTNDIVEMGANNCSPVGVSPGDTIPDGGSAVE